MLNINNNAPINFFGRNQNPSVQKDSKEIEKQYNEYKNDWINASENLDIPADIFYDYLQKLENEKQIELLKLDLEA